MIYITVLNNDVFKEYFLDEEKGNALNNWLEYNSARKIEYTRKDN